MPSEITSAIACRSHGRLRTIGCTSMNSAALSLRLKDQRRFLRRLRVRGSDGERLVCPDVAAPCSMCVYCTVGYAIMSYDDGKARDRAPRYFEM